jgi:hypothetical protein
VTEKRMAAAMRCRVFLRRDLPRALLGGVAEKSRAYGQPRRSSEDGVEIGRRRRQCRMKHKVALGVAREHAVQNGKVIVDVEVKRTEPLNEVDRAALWILDAVALRARAVAREHRLDEGPRDRREHVGLEGHEFAKLVRQRQDVLPQSNIGDDPVDQEGGSVCHASARATRTDAAAAAGESDQQVVATRVAPGAGEAPTEVPAREICAELLLDVARQTTVVVCARVGEEGLEVLADKTVQDGFLRATRNIRRCRRPVCNVAKLRDMQGRQDSGGGVPGQSPDDPVSFGAAAVEATAHPLCDDGLELGSSFLPEAVTGLENIQSCMRQLLA